MSQQATDRYYVHRVTAMTLCSQVMNHSGSSGCNQQLHPCAATPELFLDDSYVIFTEIISVSCSLSLAGIVGNILAIKTFVSIGLKDGVTISFMFLAISDLLYLISVSANSISLWFYATEKRQRFKKWFSIDPFGVYIFSANAGIMLYLLTVLTTTFIAVIRCMCVAVPLGSRTSSIGRNRR
ncbi:hypothetical protein Btru_053496 [Bulinus truncatus]|nr:hypothetical protein Btru_053496 [Bulinus truncatus]